MEKPVIHPSAYVAPGAFVRGDVTVGEQTNIWYNAVLRGDQEKITVGKAATIQDCCVLHGDAGCDVVVGDYVTVGHGAVLHGCTVEDNCLIGMNAVVLDHAVIGAGSIVGAGAVVASGTVIPPKSLVVGGPRQGEEDPHRRGRGRQRGQRQELPGPHGQGHGRPGQPGLTSRISQPSTGGRPLSAPRCPVS